MIPYFFAIANFTVYGAYIVLFAFSVHATVHQRSRGYKTNVVLLSLMFSAITGYLITQGVCVAALPTHDGSVATLVTFYISEILLVFCHVLADFIILRRCYIIWNKRKDVMIFPCILLLSSAAFGFNGGVSGVFAPSEMGHIDIYVTPALAGFYGTSLLTNLLVTGLTIGRIYWLRKKGDSILGGQTKEMYETVLMMILESGLIYSTALFILLIMFVAGERIISQNIILPLVVQTSGITPTVLLLRSAQAARRIRQVESARVFQFGGAVPAAIATVQGLPTDDKQQFELPMYTGAGQTGGIPNGVLLSVDGNGSQPANESRNGYPSPVPASSVIMAHPCSSPGGSEHVDVAILDITLFKRSLVQVTDGRKVLEKFVMDKGEQR